ncbi:eukaryotic translation initiation factor 4E-binding protein Mextli isoform X2 [Sitophilus oryzae]|uniref:Eukaryotic translation initiation factor 4E-binding protein Mextli isoform X2 n=1 Tax=Sitophilus oryzae TaxID=7048 RepID=A0A6J2XER7_SITOR|nr:eukaryotic translation initiation factor 4E-binding protein Mextli isoform X2 [Sitophilus oryzae]
MNLAKKFEKIHLSRIKVLQRSRRNKENTSSFIGFSRGFSKGSKPYYLKKSTHACDDITCTCVLKVDSSRCFDSRINSVGEIFDDNITNKKFDSQQGHKRFPQTKMSSGLASRLKHPKKHELVKSHSQAQILANKLRQDGVMVAVEGVLQAVDQVAALLISNIPDINYKDSIINLCQHLKVYGAYLEILYKEQLDHAFKVFRDKAQDDTRVDMLSRLHLLELIELRAKGWKGTDGMNMYYKKKLNQCSQVDLSDSVTSIADSMSSVLTLNSSQPLLGPGEVIKPSGKFAKPTRIPGKKYCKDEVVIRNADSGKVSPGAKERLVQITGANEESINHAKQLIEDTIRRNASPVREGSSGAGGPLTGSSSSINSSASDDSALPSSARASRALMHSLSTPDANLGEYKYTVITNGHTIKITGDNLDLVRTSKLVLDEYFSGETIHDAAQFYSFDSLPQPVLPDSILDSPISPPDALPAAWPLVNGQTPLTPTTAAASTVPSPATPPAAPPKDEPDQKNTLRQPRLSAEDVLKAAKISQVADASPVTTPKTPNFVKNPLTYSIEILAQLAMSPLCLSEPNEWERILQEYPTLARKVVQSFDAKQYLSIRTEEPIGLLNSDDIPEDV